MENAKKICIDCGAEFTPIYSHHIRCKSCWIDFRNKTAKKCTICGKPLTWEEESNGWRHCSKCHFKEMAKTLV